MKKGKLEREDGERLMQMYRKIDLDGELRERFTPSEMVLLYCIANKIMKGEIVNVETIY